MAEDGRPRRSSVSHSKAGDEQENRNPNKASPKSKQFRTAFLNINPQTEDGRESPLDLNAADAMAPAEDVLIDRVRRGSRASEDRKVRPNANASTASSPLPSPTTEAPSPNPI